jgi:hypothetical protein
MSPMNLTSKIRFNYLDGAYVICNVEIVVLDPEGVIRDGIHYQNESFESKPKLAETGVNSRSVISSIVQLIPLLGRE